MYIDIFPKYNKVSDSRLSGSTVIVVDVLRSTTSIIWAVRNGASRIVPAKDAGEAAEIYNRLGASDCVLAGEINGIKHPDFDIGNSPSEFSAAVVKGKTIIISTSNGTAAVNGVKSAKSILIGAMINRLAVAKRAVEIGDDVIIVCAGTNDSISADDLCAAGAIANAIRNVTKQPIVESDIAFVCRNLYKDWKIGTADLTKTAHWTKLTQLGFEEDIKFCFTPDITDIVPEYNNGIIE